MQFLKSDCYEEKTNKQTKNYEISSGAKNICFTFIHSRMKKIETKINSELVTCVKTFAVNSAATAAEVYHVGSKRHR